VDPTDPTVSAPQDEETPGGPYLPPPSEPIDPGALDPNDPPRFLEPIDDELIPEGWVQVRRIDPDTGEEYWTLIPDDIPLSVAVPKTGGDSGVVFIIILLGAGILVSYGAGTLKQNRFLKK
jgi:hypothetical protein